jgi:hypothetical protein
MSDAAFDPTGDDHMSPEERAVVADLAAVMDRAAALDLLESDSIGVVQFTRAWEKQMRREPAVIGHRVVAEIADRGIASELNCRSTVALLVQMLGLSMGEASARFRAAANLAARRTLTGQVLPPLFGLVAAAQAEGLISAPAARVITKTIDDLPDAALAERGDWYEKFLVENASTLDFNGLNRVARHVLYAADPDGVLKTDSEQQHGRSVRLVERRDGSFDLSGRLTAVAGGLWQTMFDALAKPMPAADGTPDPRLPAQRMHDAFAAVPKLVMRAELLPEVGGLVATFMVTMTADQLTSGEGNALTLHGGLVPVRRVLELAPDAQIQSVVLDVHGGIQSYGRKRRIAPPAMRRAIIARDCGCSSPGCTNPAAWSELHHLIAWEDGGATSVENLALLCGEHHRNFERRGWRGVMIDGVPHWIPPHWIDPEQKPQRNTVHHVEQLLADLPVLETTSVD